ncbi:sulfatase-like hydrolase/transferase [Paenibacillus sp. MER 180]|uniref:sulfatase-like hydrolase/transferase n=1 Tax=Paenibacillus sp. MER 180 TaxID=2939570 RepID=UPI0020406A28|nr:sulfatase-like hydrolase/transferase [Paenibacillus sp. MER 180]MCM3288878.1 sulfatase-like hydrolase/transferase [Paenibacillus sp. MER 180]
MNQASPIVGSLHKPNFLVLLVDEERYPPVYENKEIREWRKNNLIAQGFLRSHGLEFHRHYIGSSACSPSRATLFTGQYPSLHGVSQTNGVAKGTFDSDMFWMDRNTVPTLGDYFRAAGYQTYYKGKWHVSYEDIVIPGTHSGLASYDPVTGIPNEQLEQLYADANRLENYGFSGWIGPEPHGKNPRNSGSSAGVGLSGRDVVYGSEAVQLLEALHQQKQEDPHAPPWLVVASFVNPHDIVLYGAFTAHMPTFRFDVGPIPDVAPPPTFYESLLTKPRCQASYRDIYPQALQPILDQPFYRKLYYQLQKNADQQLLKVLDALNRSSFYDNTIIIFTSDHGDLLGSHGDLHQKWYCAYEEMIHVPLVIHHPQLFPQHQHIHSLTSHVDLIPTMLGLANADIDAIHKQLQTSFSEAQPLVGRNLSSAILDQQHAIPEGPIYFMTDDDVTRGQHQVNVLGQPYSAVIQPNHVETVMDTLDNNGKLEIWKLSRYFDNPQFWSDPGVQDVTSQLTGMTEGTDGQLPQACWATHVKTVPLADEYELYNITEDPLEIYNLVYPTYSTPYTQHIQAWMTQLLDEQRKQKRLNPSNSS